MKNRLAIILVVLLLFCSSCSQSRTNEYIFAMDTYISLDIYGDDSVHKNIKNEITRLDNLFSVTNENSDVSKINSSSSTAVDDDTKNIISRALELSSLTDGAFDISIYPVVSLWGFTKESHYIPNQNEVDDALKKVGYKKISLNGNSVSTDCEIDLGAIAKGFTCDKILDILKRSQAKSAVISMGGNVLLYGKKPNGENWRVGIQHPTKSDEIIGTLSTYDVSVVTSGSYQRYFEQEGKRYHHIIDTKTGRPADSGILSVTIISNDATAADALSTALFVMGREKAEDFWHKQKNFEMIIVDENYNVFITEGLKDCFVLKDLNYNLKVII